jgi:hypothetical protein
MLRRIFSFVIIAAAISSCGNSGKKEVSSKTEVSELSMKVEFASLAENPDNYINKNIIVEGKVVHVCTMSGKKLFIVGKNPDVRLFISAGEDMPKFPMELLGSEVVVEGRIIKVDSSVVAAGETRANSMGVTNSVKGVPKTMSGDSCVTETALSKQTALANIIMQYKNHMVK